MGTYRKKPGEVTAVRWDGVDADGLLNWVGQLNLKFAGTGDGTLLLWIIKSQAWGKVHVGDWIIAEADGVGFYPCTAARFDETYEQVNV